MAAVEFIHVKKSYDGVVAVNDLTFAIEPGQVFGLLGPNGAGKTSTLRMMIGVIAPDAGTIHLFGEPFQRRLLSRVGYLPEERGLYKTMIVLDHLVFLGQLGGLSAAQAVRSSRILAERIEAGSLLGKRVEELSKGNQQKIQFIAAVLHAPDLIIMDEPFAGLDPINAALLSGLILELKQRGGAVLLSTHRMDQAERLCDEICLIDRGVPILQGSTRSIKARRATGRVQLAYEGDGNFLRQDGLVQSCDDRGDFVEVMLKPGADPQELLKAALQGASVSRFVLEEPSLEEIFIEAVGGRDA